MGGVSLIAARNVRKMNLLGAEPCTRVFRELANPDRRVSARCSFSQFFIPSSSAWSGAWPWVWSHTISKHLSNRFQLFCIASAFPISSPGTYLCPVRWFRSTNQPATRQSWSRTILGVYDSSRFGRSSTDRAGCAFNRNWGFVVCSCTCLRQHSVVMSPCTEMHDFIENVATDDVPAEMAHSRRTR
jgi:hypothetical protein